MSSSIRRAVTPPLPVPAAAASSGAVAGGAAGEEVEGRESDHLALAHVPSPRDYRIQDRLLAHFAGTAAGVLPVIVGDVLGSAIVAGARHTELRHALREAGILTGFRLAAGVVTSLGVTAVGDCMERRRGGSRSELGISERQIRTAIVAAAFTASTNAAVDAGLGIAAQSANTERGAIDPQQALLETAASTVISGALAVTGAVVAYRTSQPIARTTNRMLESGAARMRNATAYVLGSRAPDAAENAPDEAERGVAPPAIEMVSRPANEDGA